MTNRVEIPVYTDRRMKGDQARPEQWLRASVAYCCSTRAARRSRSFPTTVGTIVKTRRGNYDNYIPFA